jgi:hypothetical protein
LLVAVGLGTFDLPQAHAQSSTSGALGRFIGPDFWGALVIHPGRIAKSPLWADLPQMPGAGGMPLAALPGIGPSEAAVAGQLLGLNASNIRRVVVMLEGMPDATGKTIPAVIVQFEDEVAPKVIAAVAASGEQGEFKGTKYVKLKTPQAQVALCAPDPTVLLVGAEPALQKMLTPPAGDQLLLDELRRISLNNDMLVAAVTAPLLKAAGPNLPPEAKPMLEGVKSAAATVNFTGDTLLHVDLVALKEETATALQMQLTMGVTLGGQQVQAWKANPPAMIPAPLAGLLVPVLEEAVAGTKVNKNGLQVTADMKMPGKLPDLVKAVAPMLAAMGSMTPPAAPPMAPPASKPAEKPPAK